jgi:hypothetical protein
MNLVEAVASLEQPSDLHVARLLLLLDAFAADSQHPEVEGLTKLAKLDFLLRYPVMLERALEAKNQSTRSVALDDHERQSVESAMVRYRFGPWDHRYREFLNVLVAKGLAVVAIEGRTVNISATPAGREVASRLAEQPLFQPYVQRARLLKRHFDLTATNLMRFIYDTFPEVVSLRSNAQIPT